MNDNDPTNFKDYPKSIAEIRSEQADDSALHAPRDALIAVLRMIDSGEENVDALVVCYRHWVDGKARARFMQATPDGLVTLGLLQTIAFQMQD